MSEKHCKICEALISSRRKYCETCSINVQKQRAKEWNKKHPQAYNKEYNNAYYKKHRKEHREKVLEYERNYREQHRQEVNRNSMLYERRKRAEELLSQSPLSCKICGTFIQDKTRRAEYCINCFKERKNQRSRQWNSEHREYIREYQKERLKRNKSNE